MLRHPGRGREIEETADHGPPVQYLEGSGDRLSCCLQLLGKMALMSSVCSLAAGGDAAAGTCFRGSCFSPSCGVEKPSHERPV